MEEELDVNEDILNTSEETTASEQVEEYIFEDDSDSDDIDYKAKYEAEAEARLKAEAIAKNQKIRAEKAEKATKTDSPKAEKSDLSTSDLYALIEAKVPQEDISEVTEYARIKGVPVSEALKSSVLKGILREKQEVRLSADATSTGPARRSSSKVGDDTLLSNAQKGIVPESEADMERLIGLRLGLK